MTLPPTIGRYHVRREIGRGTMGVVYEAHDPDLDRTIALKTIELAFGATAEERADFENRFFAEARIAARLSHPGIVAVHDVGRDHATGTLFIALEHLHGRPLDDVLKGTARMDWRRALEIVRRLAEALAHAHALGVVHRDVKPSNVMLLPSGEPKVMDFGIAKAGTARIKTTATGQFFGTPLFMAPEQAMAGPVDGRADLFSLGAIAYLLLTGRQAFWGENAARIVTRVVQEDPAPPSAFVPELPAEVDYVVGRSLAKRPEDRYPDGRTLAEDVEDVLAGRPPRHRGSWTPPARRLPPTTLLRMEPPLEVDLEPLAEGTSVAGTPVDIEAELATLVSPTPESAAARTTPARSHRLAPWPWIAGGAVVVLGGLLLLAARGRVPTQAPRASPSTGGSVKPALPTLTSPPQELAARLRVEFEHPLRSGTLRLWLDDELALEEPLEGHVARKIVGIKFRKGVVEETLAVPPGRHQVRVQVAWDDKKKTESVSGTFRAGEERRLRIRMSRLRKDLSVEWEATPEGEPS
ncbi:MAG: serine/threonine protein kinase [Acidobacteria bacterium]|nr:serine/threonine protein kinase [Acidobacteriota bacterium]